jgi:hypothetical protein
MTTRIRDEKRKLTLADLLAERAEIEQRRAQVEHQRLLRQIERERKQRARFYVQTKKALNAAFGTDAIRAVVNLVLREKGLVK